MYVLNTSYAYGSDEEKSIEAELESRFEQYDMVYRNNDTSIGALPGWIVLLAFVILMIILFIMCGSWIEPFLFLITIGIAIVINMGTNIVMGSVSNITFSIAAILQLVLSMDYSIILMNRYRQEKQLTENKEDAMKSALVHAFSSITGSSMTTIVGLLALVFMSFKIGIDLGVVLAKGVLISMLCIFTVLPFIILACDGLIQKTTKKELNVPMNKVAAFSYRFRYALSGIFVVMFVGFYFLQSNTETAYILANEDPIAEIFPSSNTVVMVYENQDEEKITDIAKELENDPNIKSVMGYASTLGKPYTAAELTDAIGDIGSDMELDKSLIDIIYYDRFSNDDLPPMTVSELLRFISSDVMENEAFSDNFDENITENIDLIMKFSEPELLTKPMTAKELSDFFDMDTEDIQQLFLFYNMQNGETETDSMTLSAFADFVINEVASDDDYSAMFDEAALSGIKMLSDFTDAEKMTAPNGYAETAELLGMDKDTVKLLFVYYYALSEEYAPQPMTISDFIRFVQVDIASEQAFSNYVDQSALAQMNMLSRYADKEIMQSQMSSNELANLFGMDDSMIQQVFMLYFAGDTDGKTMSPEQMVDFLLTNAMMSENLDEATKQQLTFIQTIIRSSISNTEYGYAQMAGLLGMEPSTMKMLFTYRDLSYGSADDQRLSMQTIVNYLVNNSAQFASVIDDNVLEQLKTAQNLINGAVSETSYSAEELASLLAMEPEQTKGLYLMYTAKHGDTSDWKMSVKAFVDFVVSDVLTNDAFSNMIGADSKDMLTTGQELINAVISGGQYTPEEMYGLFAGIADQLDYDTIELLYLFRASTVESDPNWEMTIEDLLTHITESILNDTRFEKMIDADMRTSIKDMEKQLDDGLAQIKGEQHSRIILSTIYPEESAETTAFFEELIRLSDEKLSGKYYLIGNSAMTYEMQQTFDNEMLFITLLTAAAIFIVIALTFRSIVIPAILVLLVQCGVYITVSIIGLQGYSIYFLALLIVECILMGATIDYGILFTNYYREKRRSMEVKDALREAYNGSIHTIMTSGLIIVLVVGIVGNCFSNPVIGQICKTLSTGALCASLLILFILPGLLAACDKFISRRKGEVNVTKSSE